MLSLPPRAPDEPKSHWLYRALRDEILSGRLRPGERLPSSRELAKIYGVARGTVVEVYEQLNAEGFTEGRFGGGTVVTSSLADSPPVLRHQQRDAVSAPPVALSARGTALDETIRELASTKAEISRLPDGFEWLRTPPVELFPIKRWLQLSTRLALANGGALLHNSPYPTDPNFQRAVANYLRVHRSVVCEPEQVFATHAMGLALREILHVLLKPGDVMWMEDPGQSAILPLARAAEVELAPIPIDAAGFDVRVALQQRPDAKLVVVTPEHQDVFGTTMTLDRRLALLDWATQHDGWIFEADYESEYRYAGRPTTSLQGLGDGKRVFYAGSFARLLFPAVRTTYLVVPPQLVATFERLRFSTLSGPPTLTQATIASFIESGELDRTVRRTREIYRARLREFRAAIEREASDLVELARIDSGMTIVGWLKPGLSAELAMRAAQQAGLRARSVAEFVYARTPLPPGLIFGFTSLAPADAGGAVARFAAALRARR